MIAQTGSFRSTNSYSPPVPPLSATELPNFVPNTFVIDELPPKAIGFNSLHLHAHIPRKIIIDALQACKNHHDAVDGIKRV